MLASISQVWSEDAVMLVFDKWFQEATLGANISAMVVYLRATNFVEEHVWLSVIHAFSSHFLFMAKV